MPVPTDTLRDTRKLNVIFACSAVLLLAATGLLIFNDYNYPWRQYQRDARVWEAALLKDPQLAMDAQQRQELDRLQEQISQAEAELAASVELKKLEAELASLGDDQKRLELPLARVKGEINPKSQQVERAALDHGPDAPQTIRLRQELADLNARFTRMNAQMVDLTSRAAAVQHKITAERQRLTDLQKSLDNLRRREQTIQERLAKVAPTGLAAIGDKLRNAPLLDWMNPSEKVQQVVVPDIRTDLNFLTVETTDRCNTCHVNIDRPEFEEGNLMLFAERQVAMFEGQNLDSVEHAVVMLDFWVESVLALGERGKAGYDNAVQAALEGINGLRGKIGREPLTSPAELFTELNRVAREQGDAASSDGGTRVARQEWYAVAAHFRADLKALLLDLQGQEAFEQLQDLYRTRLFAAYNGHRRQAGLPELNLSPVLLAHPRLDLYVEAESKHPMKVMGCTSCHEGSGQETIFEHVAHSPREMWVDAQTGHPVPEFLIRKQGSPAELSRAMTPTAAAAPPPGVALDGASVAYASATAAEQVAPADADHVATLAAATSESHPADHDGHRYTHFDVNLVDPHNPAPYAPDPGGYQAALYFDPAGQESLRLAKRQADYWTEKYHWAPVHYMHWEKPMHSLEFTESSCNKCHTEVFDIKEAAPSLYEGRHLFASLGCVNCHSVDSLKDDPDIYIDADTPNAKLRQVGPSLVHVKEKLSARMMANWIWAPKAFRPTTRMPHFFMLENNSTPADILRTRTEVTAMTYYLTQTPPPATAPTYSPEPPPETTGDPENGKAIFNGVGCLACHTNLDEHGQRWIVDDLVRRERLSDEQAQERFAAMSYNQRHWYAQQHLEDKLVNVGPELSGVATKLLASRSPDKARDWLYDWVRNPSHYSQHSVMPSFRLTPEEANDLTAYLLTLRRPTQSEQTPGEYSIEAFGFDEEGKPAQLDQATRVMLGELVANQMASQSTLEQARQAVFGTADKPGMPVEEQLQYLGKRMLTHYGCNGCHAINGFEDAASACTNLDEWGLKDPHKLDFGYFDHAFDKDRQTPIQVWKVRHEGLDADASRVTHQSQGDLGDGRARVVPVEVSWEHMDLERRPWLYHKLHNTRVYDRGRSGLESPVQSAQALDAAVAAGRIDVGRPYDKLKMPKFFLSDRQAHALVTFVTSIRKPLVSVALQQQTYSPEKKLQTRGRQVATVYNCYGCHNVDGNAVHIQEFYDVHNPDGSFNYENLNNAPPRLVGQGGKTQPDWLFYFLRNVHPLRPWLKVRMPSFHLSDPETQGLVGYFAGGSQVMAGNLQRWIAAIDDFRKTSPDAPWFDAGPTRLQKLHVPVSHLRAWAMLADLARPRDIDPRQSTLEERRDKWERVLREARFLAEANDVPYPFPPTPRPQLSDEQFARGEAVFNELKCVQCHALGDEKLLYQMWEKDNAGQPAAPAEDIVDGYDDGYGEEASVVAPAPAADDGYGDDDGYGEDAPASRKQIPPFLQTRPGPAWSAPNLIHAHRRLQYQWFYHWLQEPATMQPGTKMPQWFPGPVTAVDKGPTPLSAFHNFPESAREQMHAMYGHSGPEQMRLLMDFLFAAGNRYYTPGAETLQGGEKPKVELKPLERLKDAPAPAAPAAPAEGETPAPGEGQPAAPAAPAGEAKPDPHAEPTASAIELHEGSQAFTGTRVVGVARMQGSVPRRRPVRMDADRYCVTSHDGKPVLDDLLIVNPDGSLRNALIYVKSGLPAGRTFPIPDDKKAPEIDQSGCVYTPHVLGMVAGQELLILNGDSTLHNVKVNSKDNGSFNEGMPVKGMQIRKRLARPEMGITFKCDVHPWMTGFVHVLPHPFFAVSDVEGRFEIKGLPPGEYELEAVHMYQRGGKPVAPVTFKVTVPDNTSVRVPDVNMTLP